MTQAQVGKVKICDAIGSWKIGNRAGDLFNAIRRHQLVHWFDLQGCMLGNDRVRKGLEALQTVKSLETLDLQDNDIDASSIPAIQDYLRFSNVRHLYLQGNALRPWHFDELEKVVSKLGRECTVYCYKNKEQPMRKLICSTVDRAGGVDESLSFSSAQLDGIFQRYRDRDAFLQSAAAAEEMPYSRTSMTAVGESREDAVAAASVEVAVDPAAQLELAGAHHRAAAAVIDAGDDDDARGADVLDHIPHQVSETSANSEMRLRPTVSPPPPSAPAPEPSHVDAMVAMGFKRDDVEVAYAKCGRDLQV